MTRIVLASGSQIRATLLRRAGVEIEVRPARIDEAAIRHALVAERASPRDIADTLAEQKARKGAARDLGAIVLGCDQVLDIDGEILSKAPDEAALRAQLDRLAGHPHRLISACVAWQDGAAIWRHAGVARLHMRRPSAVYLDGYVRRNWDEVRQSVGGYMIEGEGVRLFERIEGDLFTIMGIPLMELLAWLTVRGEIDG